MSEQIVGFVNPDGSGEGNWSRVCEQHPEPNPLCHVQQAAPRRQPAFMQQATPDHDHGMSWQMLCDVFVAAIAVAFILWVALVLTTAPAVYRVAP